MWQQLDTHQTNWDSAHPDHEQDSLSKYTWNADVNAPLWAHANVYVNMCDDSQKEDVGFSNS